VATVSPRRECCRWTVSESEELDGTVLTAFPFAESEVNH